MGVQGYNIGQQDRQWSLHTQCLTVVKFLGDHELDVLWKISIANASHLSIITVPSQLKS